MEPPFELAGEASAKRTSARSALLILALALLSFLLLTCCSRQRVVLGPAHRLPEPVHIVLPVPQEVFDVSDTITEVAMRNVLFHMDDDLRLRIRYLRGRMHDLEGEHIIVLDDKHRLLMEIAYGEISLTDQDLMLLLNRYVFGYADSPLKDLVVRTEGDRIVQTGIVHKLIDIPFEMTATLGVTEEGMIRVSPVRMVICGLDGQKLLRVVGATLEDLLDLSGARGVRVEGNDLFVDPTDILPPPRIAGRLTRVHVEGNRIVQVFGSSDAPGTAPIPLPVAADNYIYFLGGTIRFGKLYMALADLLSIDTDPSDPFDFYLDYYHTQLVAGYHVTDPNYGLLTYMPDFDDIGTPRGKGAPPPIPH